MSKLIINGTYRHFKGNKYKILQIAKHSETLEDMVIYQALYGEQLIWCRPLNMFLENVCRDGKVIERFSYVPPEIETCISIELDQDIKKYCFENDIDLIQEVKKEYPQITCQSEFGNDGDKDVGVIILCSGVAASLVVMSISKLIETILHRPRYLKIEELNDNGEVCRRRTELLQPDFPKNSFEIGFEVDAAKAKITIKDRKE